jgi:hypothetical protein
VIFIKITEKQIPKNFHLFIEDKNIFEIIIKFLKKQILDNLHLKNRIIEVFKNQCLNKFSLKNLIIETFFKAKYTSGH